MDHTIQGSLGRVPLVQPDPTPFLGNLTVCLSICLDIQFINPSKKTLRFLCGKALVKYLLYYFSELVYVMHFIMYYDAKFRISMLSTM